ncbi:MAG TPA: carboxypeptidase regulatory-like domain-containing protein, partial [Kofleriaceae bacterium]|nr:carboxypeptidase regulatory-like domain-containing protein [Kofleriaceae bacterium]
MRLRWLRGRRGWSALGGAALALAAAGGLYCARRGAGDGAPDATAPATVAPPDRAAQAGGPRADVAPPIAGWIVDDAAAPIAGARVSVAGQVATTAADGSFRLAPPAGGEHTLVIDGPGVHESEVRWRAGAPPARILVPRRIEVVARVTRSGKPAAGIEVALRDGSGPARATARSDASGLVRFTGLPQGRYEVSAHGPGESSRLVQVSPGTTEIALATATDVRGRVRADDGAAVRATVTLVPAPGDLAVRTAETDAAGTFSIAGVPPGRWDVEVDAIGHVPAAAYVLDASGARADLDLRVRRGGAVAGLV